MSENTALPATFLDLHRFTWEKDKKKLVAEAGDFGPVRHGHPWMYMKGREWHVSIKSARTGRVVEFRLDQWLTGEEGEVLAWVFKPCENLLNVTELIIFSD